MAYYVSKSDERKERENKILRDFGCNANTATKEQREKAEYIAEKTRELQKNWRD